MRRICGRPPAKELAAATFRQQGQPVTDARGVTVSAGQQFHCFKFAGQATAVLPKLSITSKTPLSLARVTRARQ